MARTKLGFRRYGQNYGSGYGQNGLWFGSGYGQNFGSGYGQQYGSNMGQGGYGDNRFGYGERFNSGGQGYDNYSASPNWYYENRQRQFSRNAPDYGRSGYGSYDDYSRGNDRYNPYGGDATGSTSQPRYDNQYGGSSNRYDDNMRND